MSIIPLANMAPPAKHKPIGITTLVIRSCKRKAQSSQSNEHNNSTVRERARERTREINTLEYTAASRRDIDINAYRSTLLQVHEPLLALEKLRRFSRVAYPPCASRQSSNAPCRRENNRFSSSPRRFHRACVAIARRASVETPTLDYIRSLDRTFLPRCPRPRRRRRRVSFRPRRTPSSFVPFAPRQSYRSSLIECPSTRASVGMALARLAKLHTERNEDGGTRIKTHQSLQTSRLRRRRRRRRTLTTLTNLHAPRRLFTRLRTIPTPLTPLALDAHLTPSSAATVTLAMRRAKFSIRHRSERPVIVPSERPAYDTIENVRSDRRRATVRHIRRRFRRFPSL